jgi:hypothetical protein
VLGDEQVRVGRFGKPATSQDESGGNIMRHTLVAVFDNRSDAQNALDELLASGFSRTDASLSGADPTGQSNNVTGDNEYLTGAHEEGFGASIKHFFTSLFGSDTNEHAMKYSYAVTRGHHVLTLTTESEPEVERAADIIERFGPVDIDERHGEWTRDAGAPGAGAAASRMQQGSSMSAQSGTPGSASGGTASSSGTYRGTPPGTEPGSLQSSGEEDRNFFGTQNINDPFPKDTTYQEPQGASMQAGGSPDSAIGGNTLSGTQSSSQNSATGTSRQATQGGLQSGSLNQSGGTLQGTASIPGSDDTSLGGTAMMGGQPGSQQRDLGARGKVRVFSHGAGSTDTSGTYDDEFRDDWIQHYSSLGGSYDDYAPAYRYGRAMRDHDQYRGSHWDDVEPRLKADWETRNPGASTWDKFKAAVRHGWDKITPGSDGDHRSHWDTHYSSLGGGYEEYEPAYRYGTEMRTSDKYRDRSWDEVESDLKSDWESRHPGASTWDKFKAAVRRGWDKITPDIDNDSYYRSHWNAKYSNANDKYDDYLPAYRYGDEARRLQKYRSRHWDDVEPDLKTDWESRYTSGTSTWEKFKDAVRHGWDKVTPDMDDDSTYYHEHYEAHYAISGTDFDDVAPAYRYGNEMRSSDTYRDRSWDDAELDLKNDWHSKYGAHGGASTWERFKAAVRHGWDKMTGDTTHAHDDSGYRTHWSSTYGTSGTSYDDVAPAYRYGAEMRNDVRYRNRDWSDVENDLHTDWEARYGKDGLSAWDKVKAAIRHGWDRATL